MKLCHLFILSSATLITIPNVLSELQEINSKNITIARDIDNQSEQIKIGRETAENANENYQNRKWFQPPWRGLRYKPVPNYVDRKKSKNILKNPRELGEKDATFLIKNMSIRQSGTQNIQEFEQCRDRRIPINLEKPLIYKENIEDMDDNDTPAYDELMKAAENKDVRLLTNIANLPENFSLKEKKVTKSTEIIPENGKFAGQDINNVPYNFFKMSSHNMESPYFMSADEVVNPKWKYLYRNPEEKYEDHKVTSENTYSCTEKMIDVTYRKDNENKQTIVNIASSGGKNGDYLNEEEMYDEDDEDYYEYHPQQTFDSKVTCIPQRKQYISVDVKTKRKEKVLIGIEDNTNLKVGKIRGESSGNLQVPDEGHEAISGSRVPVIAGNHPNIPEIASSASPNTRTHRHPPPTVEQGNFGDAGKTFYSAANENPCLKESETEHEQNVITSEVDRSNKSYCIKREDSQDGNDVHVYYEDMYTECYDENHNNDNINAGKVKEAFTEDDSRMSPSFVPAMSRRKRDGNGRTDWDENEDLSGFVKPQKNYIDVFSFSAPITEERHIKKTKVGFVKKVRDKIMNKIIGDGWRKYRDVSSIGDSEGVMEEVNMESVTEENTLYNEAAIERKSTNIVSKTPVLKRPVVNMEETDVDKTKTAPETPKRVKQHETYLEEGKSNHDYNKITILIPDHKVNDKNSGKRENDDTLLYSMRYAHRSLSPKKEAMEKGAEVAIENNRKETTHNSNNGKKNRRNKTNVNTPLGNFSIHFNAGQAISMPEQVTNESAFSGSNDRNQECIAIDEGLTNVERIKDLRTTTELDITTQYETKNSLPPREVQFQKTVSQQSKMSNEAVQTNPPETTAAPFVSGLYTESPIGITNEKVEQNNFNFNNIDQVIYFVTEHKNIIEDLFSNQGETLEGTFEEQQRSCRTPKKQISAYRNNKGSNLTSIEKIKVLTTTELGYHSSCTTSEDLQKNIVTTLVTKNKNSLGRIRDKLKLQMEEIIKIQEPEILNASGVSFFYYDRSNNATNIIVIQPLKNFSKKFKASLITTSKGRFHNRKANNTLERNSETSGRISTDLGFKRNGMSNGRIEIESKEIKATTSFINGALSCNVQRYDNKHENTRTYYIPILISKKGPVSHGNISDKTNTSSDRIKYIMKNIPGVLNATSKKGKSEVNEVNIISIERNKVPSSSPGYHRMDITSDRTKILCSTLATKQNNILLKNTCSQFELTKPGLLRTLIYKAGRNVTDFRMGGQTNNTILNIIYTPPLKKFFGKLKSNILSTTKRNEMVKYVKPINSTIVKNYEVKVYPASNVGNSSFRVPIKVNELGPKTSPKETANPFVHLAIKQTKMLAEKVKKKINKWSDWVSASFITRSSSNVEFVTSKDTFMSHTEILNVTKKYATALTTVQSKHFDRTSNTPTSVEGHQYRERRPNNAIFAHFNKTSNNSFVNMIFSPPLKSLVEKIKSNLITTREGRTQHHSGEKVMNSLEELYDFIYSIPYDKKTEVPETQDTTVRCYSKKSAGAGMKFYLLLNNDMESNSNKNKTNNQIISKNNNLDELNHIITLQQNKPLIQRKSFVGRAKDKLIGKSQTIPDSGIFLSKYSNPENVIHEGRMSNFKSTTSCYSNNITGNRNVISALPTKQSKTLIERISNSVRKSRKKGKSYELEGIQENKSVDPENIINEERIKNITSTTKRYQNNITPESRKVISGSPTKKRKNIIERINNRFRKVKKKGNISELQGVPEKESVDPEKIINEERIKNITSATMSGYHINITAESQNVISALPTKKRKTIIEKISKKFRKVKEMGKSSELEGITEKESVDPENIINEERIKNITSTTNSGYHNNITTESRNVISGSPTKKRKNVIERINNRFRKVKKKGKISVLEGVSEKESVDPENIINEERIKNITSTTKRYQNNITPVSLTVISGSPTKKRKNVIERINNSFRKVQKKGKISELEGVSEKESVDPEHIINEERIKNITSTTKRYQNNITPESRNVISGSPTKKRKNVIERINNRFRKVEKKGKISELEGVPEKEPVDPENIINEERIKNITSTTKRYQNNITPVSLTVISGSPTKKRKNVIERINNSFRKVQKKGKISELEGVSEKESVDPEHIINEERIKNITSTTKRYQNNITPESRNVISGSPTKKRRNVIERINNRFRKVKKNEKISELEGVPEKESVDPENIINEERIKNITSTTKRYHNNITPENQNVISTLPTKKNKNIIEIISNRFREIEEKGKTSELGGIPERESVDSGKVIHEERIKNITSTTMSGYHNNITTQSRNANSASPTKKSKYIIERISNRFRKVQEKGNISELEGITEKVSVDLENIINEERIKNITSTIMPGDQNNIAIESRNVISALPTKKSKNVFGRISNGFRKVKEQYSELSGIPLTNRAMESIDVPSKTERTTELSNKSNMKETKAGIPQVDSEFSYLHLNSNDQLESKHQNQSNISSRTSKRKFFGKVKDDMKKWSGRSQAEEDMAVQMYNIYNNSECVFSKKQNRTGYCYGSADNAKNAPSPLTLIQSKHRENTCILKKEGGKYEIPTNLFVESSAGRPHNNEYLICIQKNKRARMDSSERNQTEFIDKEKLNNTFIEYYYVIPAYIPITDINTTKTKDMTYRKQENGRSIGYLPLNSDNLRNKENIPYKIIPERHFFFLVPNIAPTNLKHVGKNLQKRNVAAEVKDKLKKWTGRSRASHGGPPLTRTFPVRDNSSEPQINKVKQLTGTYPGNDGTPESQITKVEQLSGTSPVNDETPDREITVYIRSDGGELKSIERIRDLRPTNISYPTLKANEIVGKRKYKRKKNTTVRSSTVSCFKCSMGTGSAKTTTRRNIILLTPQKKSFYGKLRDRMKKLGKRRHERYRYDQEPNNGHMSDSVERLSFGKHVTESIIKIVSKGSKKIHKNQTFYTIIPSENVCKYIKMKIINPDANHGNMSKTSVPLSMNGKRNSTRRVNENQKLLIGSNRSEIILGTVKHRSVRRSKNLAEQSMDTESINKTTYNENYSSFNNKHSATQENDYIENRLFQSAGENVNLIPSKIELMRMSGDGAERLGPILEEEVGFFPHIGGIMLLPPQNYQTNLETKRLRHNKVPATKPEDTVTFRETAFQRKIMKNLRNNLIVGQKNRHRFHQKYKNKMLADINRLHCYRRKNPPLFTDKEVRRKQMQMRRKFKNRYRKIFYPSMKIKHGQFNHRNANSSYGGRTNFSLQKAESTLGKTTEIPVTVKMVTNTGMFKISLKHPFCHRKKINEDIYRKFQEHNKEKHYKKPTGLTNKLKIIFKGNDNAYSSMTVLHENQNNTERYVYRYDNELNNGNMSDSKERLNFEKPVNESNIKMYIDNKRLSQWNRRKTIISDNPDETLNRNKQKIFRNSRKHIIRKPYYMVYRESDDELLNRISSGKRFRSRTDKAMHWRIPAKHLNHYKQSYCRNLPFQEETFHKNQSEIRVSLLMPNKRERLGLDHRQVRARPDRTCGDAHQNSEHVQRSGISAVPLFRGKHWRRGRQITSSGTQIRGGQSCMDRNTPDGLDPLSYHESAHCLRFSELWYTVYKLKVPFIVHQIEIEIFEKHCRESEYSWELVTQGAKAEIGTFIRRIADQIPTIVISYSPLTTVDDEFFCLDPGETTLLVPRPLPPDKEDQYPEVGGIGKFLLVRSDDVSYDGEDCDKCGVSYTAFATQPERCNRPRGTCLHNQPLDFWRQDMMAKENNQPGIHFLENYANIPQDVMRKSDKRDYLTLEYKGYFASIVEIEMNADSNAVLKSIGTAQISEIYVDSSCEFHTTVTLVVTNTGLSSAAFRPRMTNCPVNVPLLWYRSEGPLIFIPPQHRHVFVHSLYGKVSTMRFHCSIEILNSEGEVTAVRRIRIQKFDRCLCMWHCLCTCIGSLQGLKCEAMSIEHYHAAGFRGDMPLTILEYGGAPRGCFSFGAFQRMLPILFLVFFVLLLAGILKALIGLFFSRRVALWHLELVCPYMVCDFENYDTVNVKRCFTCKNFTFDDFRFRNNEYFFNSVFFMVAPGGVLLRLIARLISHCSNSMNKLLPEEFN